MPSSLNGVRVNRRLLVFSAAAMYGGAAFISLVEGLIPGGPRFSFTPGIVAFVLVVSLLLVGFRVPYAALAALGPLGVVLIGYALATTPGAGDGAVLYVWPVLWQTFFFGRKGAIGIVASIGVAHAVVLGTLPADIGYPDRWVDVMVTMAVVAGVVDVLAARNDELVARLAAEARTDKLTGLLNRRGFEEHANVELAHARRSRGVITAASFDIDYFKHVNDEWGHETGDRVLARLATLLTVESRDIDVVARVGGEEFVVLLPGCDAQQGEWFTDRIRLALAADVDDGLPAIHVSAGVAADAPPASIDELLRRADTALYAAKRAGRNRTVVYGDGGKPALRLEAQA